MSSFSFRNLPLVLAGLLGLWSGPDLLHLPSAAAMAAPVPEPLTAPVTSRARPSGPGTPSDLAFLSVPDQATPRLIAALGEHGLAWFSLAGDELGRLDGVNSSLVDVLPGGTPANPAPTVVANNALTGRLHLFQLDPAGESLLELESQSISLDDELTGLCHTFSALSRAWQLFGVTDSGMVHQWEIDPSGQKPPQLLRSLAAGKGAGHCVVDGSSRTLYLAQESLGVWQTGSEPESEPAFTILGLSEPWGMLSDDIKGLALMPGPEGGYLLVSDVGAGRIRVLEARSGALLGEFTVAGLGEAEGLASLANESESLVAIADEDDGPGGRQLILLDWAPLAASLGLEPAPFAGGSETGSLPAVVRPVTETAPVESFGDAADDPAIWVHPTEPELSLVVGSEKQRGLYLYDLGGQSLQFLPAGRINNVDLRDGFPLGDRSVTLVAGSDRTRGGIALFLLDGPGQRLEQLDASFIPTDLADPYGLCLYRSARDGSFQVFVNDSADGRTVQYRLQDDGDGGIAHERLRELAVGAQAEGCVADDETGNLFIAEEGHGIWKYSAEAGSGTDRSLVDSVASGRIEPDVEGLAIWKGPDGSGVLLASNQGRDSYLLYDRKSPHDYLGEFFVVAGDGIDGASETDGLEVSSANLGPAYPEGLVVVQDGRNLGPRERQNFKYLSWADIRAALAETNASE